MHRIHRVVLGLLMIELSFLHNVLADHGKRNKVVNGIQAKEGEFPYVVSLQRGSREHFCGGSLVSLSWILTVCHCTGRFTKGDIFEHFIPWELLAVAGSIDRTWDGDNQVRQLSRVLSHPKCANEVPGWNNDYGLYETMKPFKEGSKLDVMKLFSWNKSELKQKTDELVQSNTVCLVVGWGHQNVTALGHYDNVSEVLMALHIYLSGHKKCNEDLCIVETTAICGEDHIYNRGQLCAYGFNDGDACTGDSGGPLVCYGSVYGLVSWGPGCGEKMAPTMYSRLDYELDFFNWARAKNKSSIIKSSIIILVLVGASLFFVEKNKV